MPLDTKKILTFDCYGTLIDWEQGIINQLSPVFQKNNVLINDNEILALFAQTEHTVQSANPSLLYKDVLKNVVIAMGQKLHCPLETVEIDDFGNSVGKWQPFPDTIDALNILSEHFKLVIVSNIDNASISDTCRLLGIPFYRIFTAQDMQAYKPDTAVFQYVLKALSLEMYEMNDILHVAESLYHDHVPAKTIGLDSVWINRRHSKPGSGATPSVDPKWIPLHVFPSLKGFASWVESDR